jgi:DNA polymerase alpha subunit A
METQPGHRPQRKKNLTSKQAALAQLAELKRSGARRSQQYQAADEGDVYDALDEEEYQELIRKRREDNFIEDDGGHGDYVDFGQDDWEEDQHSNDDEPLSKRAKSGEGTERKRGVFNNLVPKKKKATERVNSMFLSAGREIMGPGGQAARAKGSVDDTDGDELLSSLLGEIEADPMSTTLGANGRKHFKRSATASAIAAARPSMPTFKPGSARLNQSMGDSIRGCSHDEGGDYSRAPPTLSGGMLDWDEDEMVGLSPAPDAAIISRSNGSSKRVEGAVPRMLEEASMPELVQDIEGSGITALRDDDEGVKGNGTAASTLVPFMTAESGGDGVDWFQVCYEDRDAIDLGSASATGVNPTVASPAPTSSVLPVREADGGVQFFWLDAYEDPLNAPGSLFLFGKVKVDAGGFTSCCASLKGFERNIYVLPRKRMLIDGLEVGDEVSFAELFKEVQQLCRAHKVTKFACKRVERSYAFEDALVPSSASYLKIVYSAEFPPLPFDASGVTYSKVFGSQTSCLERLLLKRRIMGPCWLHLSDVALATTQSSWCKCEIILRGGKKAITPLDDPPPSPPLVVASLRVQTILNARHVPEIVLASLISHANVSCDGATPNPTALSAFSVVRKPDGHAWPWDLQRTVQANKQHKLEICVSERALLNYLIARLHSLDADVLVGHNIAAFDIAVLLQRLDAQKVAQWSKVGRMRIKVMPKLSGTTSAFSGSNWAEWSVVAGRLMADTYLSARELLPSQRSYGLKELARSHLNASKPEVEQAAVVGMFDDTTHILHLVRCTENDAFLSLQLLFKMMVLPLTKQLTNLAGNLWTKSLQGKRAERIEYLLLHEFHRLKYVPPDKETYKMRMAKKERRKDNLCGNLVEKTLEDPMGNEEGGDNDEEGSARRGIGQSGRKKPAYAGGLVLEPKRGFYDKCAHPCAISFVDSPTNASRYRGPLNAFYPRLTLPDMCYF